MLLLLSHTPSVCVFVTRNVYNMLAHIAMCTGCYHYDMVILLVSSYMYWNSRAQLAWGHLHPLTNTGFTQGVAFTFTLPYVILAYWVFNYDIVQ